MSSENRVTIRRAHLHETLTLTDIALRAKQSNGYDDSFMAACEDELKVTVYDMRKGEYWVAEQGEICGFVCLISSAEAEIGEVHSFFIAPAWQRRGVGKKLWLKISQRARSIGMLKLQLDADPSAVKFYEAIGFKTIASVPSGSIKGRFIPRMVVCL